MHGKLAAAARRTVCNLRRSTVAAFWRIPLARMRQRQVDQRENAVVLRRRQRRHSNAVYSVRYRLALPAQSQRKARRQKQRQQSLQSPYIVLLRKYSVINVIQA